MLSDHILANAGFDLYCIHYADEFERKGGSFGGGANIMDCVTRLPDDKYIPIMRKYVEKLDKAWGVPTETMFERMGLESDTDQADALYYILMQCMGHGIGLDDKFPEAVEQYEETHGALDQSPIHTEMSDMSELAHENLETPDEEWGIFDEAGELVSGKFWDEESAEDDKENWGDEYTVKLVEPEPGNELLEDVSSKYGAPMGRPEIVGNTAAAVKVFRVKFQDGDYDMGGAYWGGGGGPLFCIHGDGFRVFRRARSHKDAREKVAAEYPELQFAD